MDFETRFRVHNLVSVYPNSIKLGRMTAPNLIFNNNNNNNNNDNNNNNNNDNDNDNDMIMIMLMIMIIILYFYSAIPIAFQKRFTMILKA